MVSRSLVGYVRVSSTRQRENTKRLRDAPASERLSEFPALHNTR